MLDHVAKVVFVTDMARLSQVVELRREFFTKPYPADSIVQVSAFYAPGTMIEVEAIAQVSHP